MLSEHEYACVLRNDLPSFIERTFRELSPQTRFHRAPYLDLLAAKLKAVADGKITRLIVNVPPRSLKSISVSVAFVAWYLGHYASRHVICASYGQDLSEKFARDCRSIMKNPFYRAAFRTRLADRQVVHDITTTENGTRLATSVNGVLTGRGADVIVIDDPLKPDEALSETKRKSVNDWFDNSLLSRLNDKTKGAIVIIMQRLHQDDLVGHVLEQGEWDVLSLAAIAEQDETYRFDTTFGPRVFQRLSGEPLNAERESLATFAAIRRTVGEYTFASQYQQTPTPLGGAMVKSKWLMRYTALPARFSGIVQSWDTASKTGEFNDYSVCTTWGVLNGKFYLLHVFRERLDYPDLRRAVVRLQQQRKANTVVIEDKASGIQIIQDLTKDGVYGIRPYKPPPGTDKQMRLHTETAMFENGHVLLPVQAPWLADYEAELTGFPGTKFDDQVDSTTQALAYFRDWYHLDVWARLAG